MLLRISIECNITELKLPIRCLYSDFGNERKEVEAEALKTTKDIKTTSVYRSSYDGVGTGSERNHDERVVPPQQSHPSTLRILALHVEEGGGALLVPGLPGHHATVLPEIPHGGRVDRQRAVPADRRPPLEILETRNCRNCGRRSREKKNSRRYLDLRDLRPLPQPGDHRLFPFGDAIEVNRLALHHGLVDGRNRQQSLAWNRRRERRRTWVERFNESARFQVSQASAGLQFGVSLVSLRLIYIYMYLYLESVNCNRFSVFFFFLLIDVISTHDPFFFFF